VRRRLTGGPTWKPLTVFGVVSSSVLKNLLGLLTPWLSVIKSNVWVHLDGFLDKPC
jgi:hypothetical protein